MEQRMDAGGLDKLHQVDLRHGESFYKGGIVNVRHVRLQMRVEPLEGRVQTNWKVSRQ